MMQPFTRRLALALSLVFPAAAAVIGTWWAATPDEATLANVAGDP